jgi:hypothetical protein
MRVCVGKNSLGTLFITQHNVVVLYPLRLPLQHKTPSKKDEAMDPQPLNGSPAILVISGMKTPLLHSLKAPHAKPQHTGLEQGPFVKQSSAMLSYWQIPASNEEQ